jgi:DNA topoisomerase VI subunit B
MQKFGLDTLKAEKLSIIELEILQEKATSLGRAGRKLRTSLEALENSNAENNKEQLLNDVIDSVWELMLQREFSGFHHKNLEWIKNTMRYRAMYSAD